MFIKFHKSGNSIFPRNHLKLDTTLEEFVCNEEEELGVACGLWEDALKIDGRRRERMLYLLFFFVAKQASLEK